MRDSFKPCWQILPSEKGAQRKRRELFSQSKDRVALGESIFSISHFLNKIASSNQPVCQRNMQYHMILYCLRNQPLKYFEKLRFNPLLARSFLKAICQLKLHAISPEKLEALLQESGSLKEYDLLKIYERYESLKRDLGFFDPEERYSLAQERLKKNSPIPKPLKKIVFENFAQSPPALENLLKEIKKSHPETEIEFHVVETIEPGILKNIGRFSFSSPYQETSWFIKKVQECLQTGVQPEEIGILTSGKSRYYESIRQKLKIFGLVKGPSPFLSFKERPEGRETLRTALTLNFKEATFSQWIEALMEKLEPGPITELAQSQLFCEKFVSLGPLKQGEWSLLLEDILRRREISSIPESLEGIQMVDLDEGDYPDLKILLVPGLIEGQFPTLSPSPFFQEKRDRQRPEWAPLKRAFPDLKTLFEEKRRLFLNHLSRGNSFSWLTYARIGSLGEDLAASPFAWDFGNFEPLPSSPPLFFLENLEEKPKAISKLSQKFRIEMERMRQNLVTGEFHARFGEKLEVGEEDHLFSATQLETYAQCPFKFFARRVLNIPRIKEYSPEVDPEDKGTLFHRALEEILSKNRELFLKARSDPKNEEALYQEVEATIDRIFSELKTDYSYVNGELYLRLKERTLEQVKQLFEKEFREARNITRPLEPLHLEWGFGKGETSPLTLPSLNENETVRLCGYIDRIDVDPESGGYLILDYKTGETAPLKKRFQEGLFLQLPIYLLAVKNLLLAEGIMLGGTLISVRSGERKHGLLNRFFNKTHFSLNGRSHSLVSEKELEEILQRTIEQVKEYVSKIRDGFFSAAPKECKTSCDYKEICRYPRKPVPS